MDALSSKGQMMDQINLGDVPRSGFDLSYSFQGSGHLGKLIPIRCMETLPGDRFKGKTTITTQFQPLAVPMLSNMYTRSETFNIPSRLTWKNWEKFITGGEKLDDTSNVPTVSLQQICYHFPFLFSIPIENTDKVYIYDSSKDEFIELHSPDWNTLSPSVKFVYVNKEDLKSFFYDNSKYNSFMDTRHPEIKRYQMMDLYDSLYQAFSNMLYNIESYFPTDKMYVAKTFGSDGNPTSYVEVLPVFSIYHASNSSNDSRMYKSLSNEYQSVGIPLYDYEIDADAVTMDLRDFIIGLFDSYWQYSEQDAYSVPYFSSEFVALMNDVYDAIAPYLGVGSLLDMMGAPFISRRDWFLGTYLNIFGMYTVNDRFPEYVFDELLDATPFSVLPFRALYLVWYWYYRDQLLETDAFEPSDDDVVTDAEYFALFTPRYRCWSKDTFTTALTNTGTGSMIVPTQKVMPSNTTNVYKKLGDFDSETVVDAESAKLQQMDVLSYTLSDGTVIELPSRYLQSMHGTISQGVTTLNNTNIGFSLDMLNRAQRMQKWLQKALIYGNRPQDSLWTHWRVRSSDARLKLPEYLSGQSALVRLDTITNNTTVGNTVAGDKAANAYSYESGMDLNTFCEEHGYIITMFTIMPELSYGYGRSRMYSRLDKFDHAWPEFAQIGMDAVYTGEIVSAGLDLHGQYSPGVENLFCSPKRVFGYQGRYYDYKSKQDEIHGALLDSMENYNFARKFNPYGGTKEPTLNYQFVHCHPRLDMFVTDSLSEPQFIFDVRHAQAVERALPVPSMSV